MTTAEDLDVHPALGLSTFTKPELLTAAKTLFVVRPHSEHSDDALLEQHLIDEAVL